MKLDLKRSFPLPRLHIWDDECPKHIWTMRQLYLIHAHGPIRRHYDVPDATSPLAVSRLRGARKSVRFMCGSEYDGAEFVQQDWWRDARRGRRQQWRWKGYSLLLLRPVADELVQYPAFDHACALPLSPMLLPSKGRESLHIMPQYLQVLQYGKGTFMNSRPPTHDAFRFV